MIKKLFLIIPILIGLLVLPACKSKLAAGGAYSPVTIVGGVTNSAPDMNLFVADASYQVAYNIMDAVFTTEKNNHALLWSLSPQIKKTLDSIRPRAWDANLRYIAAREAYLALPTPVNLTGVQAVLAEIQQLATAAQAALPK